MEHILIVDDEVGICRTLEGVLRDEGLQAQIAHSGEAALRMAVESRPALVILDIWMPGMDGIETLKRLKELYIDLPVLMISGHATIASAISATKLGAADFIEKPLDLEVLLNSVKKTLGLVTDTPDSPSRANGRSEQFYNLGTLSDTSTIQPIVFESQKLRGRELVQRTLARSALLYGQGLHSGKKSGLILEPLPPNSGIHFAGVSQSEIVPAHVDFVESTGFATTIRRSSISAGTIEHLMSALHAYGISNLLIKCNGEVPVMDGSAMSFCSLIEETGLEEQGGGWFEIEVRESVKVKEGREFMMFEPCSEGFVVEYILDYPAPVGRQQMIFKLNGPETYKAQIAPARTFGFVKDVGYLQQQGLALGGRFDNFVLFGENGAINCDLRFPDEPVRHKILDLIGDLYLLGRPIRGKVTACMTGHSDNVALLKALKSAMQIDS